MAHVESNFEEFAAKLRDAVASYNFLVAGVEGSLGQDLAGAVVTGHMDRVEAQVDPDGNAWADNADNPEGKGYKSWKLKKGQPNVGIGVEKEGDDTGHMASKENFGGKIEVDPYEVRVYYGKDDWSKRKLLFFTHGSEGPEGERSGAKNQPPRPIWGMNDAIRAECRQLAADAFEKHRP